MSQSGLSVRKFCQITKIVCKFVVAVVIFTLANLQKIPHFYRRETQRSSTPVKEDLLTTSNITYKYERTPSNLSNSSLNSSTDIKKSIDKYKHVKSKTNSFWSPQEKEKSASIRSFFERKDFSMKNSSQISNSSINSSATTTHSSGSSRRQSLQGDGMDVIGKSLEALRRSMQAPSAASSTTSATYIPMLSKK
jgi:hypothetical protein